MTANAKGFVVTLAQDIHDEDVLRVVGLLMLIKGVVHVDTVTDNGYSDVVNRERIRAELLQQVLKVIRDGG